MKTNKPKQIIVQFSENSKEMHDVQEKLNSGWGMTNLVANNIHYVAILEEQNFPENLEDVKVFIPARTKIQLT